MEELRLKDIFKGNFYHVCTNGLEHVVLLKDEEDYRTAWNYLALSSWRTDVTTVAFTLMSNHIHTLVGCQDASQADKMIKLFKQLLSRYLRKKYGMIKTLHEKQDCISLIDSVKYLKNCIAYILRNAVCARVCTRPEDYRWSSYGCMFSSKKTEMGTPVSEMTFTQKRRLLKTGFDLSDCPFRIGTDGYICLDSFVNSHIAEKAYKNYVKSFLYYMGCCDDTKMEYELACRPLIHVSDMEMLETVSRYVAHRFRGKEIPELTSSEKCSILKHLFFSNKTSIPQLSRIMGLSNDIVRKMISS